LIAMRPLTRLLLVLLLAGSSACSKSKAPASTGADAGTTARQTPLSARDAATSDAAPGASASAADAGPALQFLGTVRGIVKLAKGAKLPVTAPPRMHGVEPPSVAPCPPIDASDRRTVELAKQTGGLSPVHVAMTGMHGVPSREPMVHEVFIDACRLRPMLVGAMRGDRVRVTNRSETALIPTMPGDKFMRGLMRGESHEATLQLTQTRILCGFGSYCGESLVIATKHPLYAVTSAEGFFTIERVPLDENLRVHAWHPLFEITSAPVRLSDDKREAMVELTLTPRPDAKVTTLPAGKDAQKPGKGGKPAKQPEPEEPYRGPAYE
jgi:hypothetical protein